MCHYALIELYIKYCGIFKIRGGSIFVGSPNPRIYILDEKNKRVGYLTETENRRIQKITSPRINKKTQQSMINGPYEFK